MKIINTTGQVGDIISISGNNLSRISNVIFSGEVPASYEEIRLDLLNTTVPHNPQAGYLTVISEEREITGYTENKFYPKPHIETLNPSTGISGESFSVSGNSLYATTGVEVNSLSADFSVQSNTGVSVTVPSGNTYGLVKVYSELPSEASGELSAESKDKFIPDIKVTGFSSPSGCSGEGIGLMGNYFFDDLMSGFSDSNNQYEIKYNESSLTGIDLLMGTVSRSYSIGSSGSDNFYETPTIKLYKNQTYYFNQSDTSNLGHQFRIGLIPDGPWGDIDSGWYSGEFKSGVTFYDTPGSGNEAYTSFEIPSGAPDKLFYYDHFYTGVGGTGYFEVLDSTGFLVTFEPSGTTGWFQKESDTLLTGIVPDWAVSGRVSIAKNENIEGNWYSSSDDKFLVPCCPLEFVEVRTQNSLNVWKPTGLSGDYYVGAAPATGRASDALGGPTAFAVKATCLGKFIDLMVTGSPGYSLRDLNMDQGSSYGVYDPYSHGPIFTIEEPQSENEQGEVQFIPPDGFQGEHDLVMADSDGNLIKAKNAIEIASDPEIDTDDSNWITDTTIQNDTEFSIVGKNLYYEQFIDGNDVLSAVFPSSPPDYCISLKFQLKNHTRIDKDNWKLDFMALPPDKNIITGIKPGANKMTLRLNNGIKIIDISGSSRYLHEPRISGFLPKTGEWGENIIISGSEFVGVTGMAIGETTINDFTIESETGIDFVIPNEATTNDIHIYGSGGGVSTADTYGKYGTEELSYNVCTFKHGSCEETGVGRDEHGNYYAAAYTLDVAKPWHGTYGTPIEPYSVGEQSGHYKLRFHARKGRLTNTLYSGYQVTGKEVLEGRGCSWMWAIVKNAQGYTTGDAVYGLGEVDTWSNSGELKFGFVGVTGDVLASGHSNGMGQISGHTGYIDFRDLRYNPARTWSQTWGADVEEIEYSPYEIPLSGIASGETLSLWIRGHSDAPNSSKTSQLNYVTGVTGIDLRLSERTYYENIYAQEVVFEDGPLCPLPPEVRTDHKGVEWKNENIIPNIVYISCLNWSHVYSGDHYNHLSDNLGKLIVEEPSIAIQDFSPKSGHYGDVISISGKSLHNVTDIIFSGHRGDSITLSRTYDVLGVSDFTGVNTTGIETAIPSGVAPYQTFSVAQKSGASIIQSSTSEDILKIIDTGIVFLGYPLSGEHGKDILISGTHLENVDFYFQGFTTGEENNYVRSLNTTLTNKTGAYISVPKEIQAGNLYVSGDDLFKVSDQFFVPIPSISGIEKTKYYVGDTFRLTGINATNAASVLAISGISSRTNKNTLEIISNSSAYVPSGERTYFNGYGSNIFDITGDMPDSLKTGQSIITGVINSSFAGTGQVFLISKDLIPENTPTFLPSAEYPNTTTSPNVIRDYVGSAQAGVKADLVFLGPSIEISGREPIVSGIYPEQGRTNTAITISGRNFLGATGVKFQDAAAGKECIVTDFISGIRLADLYGDPIYDQVHLIDIYPCDWGSPTGEILIMDHNYNG